VDLGAEVQLGKNRNRSPGTQVRGGPTGVTFIDKSGEKALAELFKQGAELIATGIYTGTSFTTSRGEISLSKF